MFASFWGMIFFCALAEDSDTKIFLLDIWAAATGPNVFCFLFRFLTLRFCMDFVASKNSAKWPTKKPGKKNENGSSNEFLPRGRKSRGKVSEGNNLTPKTSVWIAWKNGVCFFCLVLNMEDGVRFFFEVVVKVIAASSRWRSLHISGWWILVGFWLRLQSWWAENSWFWQPTSGLNRQLVTSKKTQHDCKQSKSHKKMEHVMCPWTIAIGCNWL